MQMRVSGKLWMIKTRVSFSHDQTSDRNVRTKANKRENGHSKSQFASKGAWNISGCNRINYHLLSRAFSQCVAVAQVIDLDVPDIITIGNIYLLVQLP